MDFCQKAPYAEFEAEPQHHIVGAGPKPRKGAALDPPEASLRTPMIAMRLIDKLC